MSQKQFMTRKPKAVRKPIRPPVNAVKKQKDGDKHSPMQASPALIQRATQAPQTITPAEATRLQRTVGNQALGRLSRVQAKLTLGPVGDKYEQEADAVAKQVVGRLGDGDQSDVQRQEEDEELQMKPSSDLQRQEEEEDLQMKPSSDLQRQEEDEELQMKPISDLQRQEEDEEELQMKPSSDLQRQEEEEELQMKSSSTMEGGDLSAGIEGQIQSAKGGGRPLSPQTQSSMSRAFNSDFSGVKIHTDTQSDQLNQSIQARAFTTGQDIFFRQGEYNPNSSGGQELLAHELTHTIQQTGGQAQRQPVVQRLITTRDFMTNSGIKKRKKKGEMSELLHVLDRYNSLRPFISTKPTESLYTQLLILLMTVENAANAWQNTTGSSKGSGRFFRIGAGTRHKKKKTAVANLLLEIKTERDILTTEKENLQTQQEVLGALDETESRPDMITSYLELPLDGDNPDTLVKKLKLSQKVLKIQLAELLEKNRKGTVNETEILTVGQSLQAAFTVVGMFTGFLGGQESTLAGNIGTSLKLALDAQIQDSDPKKLYEFSHLDKTQGMNMEAKDIKAAVHTAVRKYLDENGQESTNVDVYIGNTNEGKLIREANMWLTNPIIKYFYDLYISDQMKLEKMVGLMDPARFKQLIEIQMEITMMAGDGRTLPGGNDVFTLSKATFY